MKYIPKLYIYFNQMFDFIVFQTGDIIGYRKYI